MSLFNTGAKLLIEQRYKKMHREDDDYCELIYECLYEEGIAIYNELSDTEFKKLIRKQYNYIENCKRRILLKETASQNNVKLFFQVTVCVPSLTHIYHNAKL